MLHFSVFFNNIKDSKPQLLEFPTQKGLAITTLVSGINIIALRLLVSYFFPGATAKAILKVKSAGLSKQ